MVASEVLGGRGVQFWNEEASCHSTWPPLSHLPHPSSKSPFVRNVLNQRRKRDVIMSFIMNSKGNKEFKEKNSGDGQRAKASQII